MTFGIPEPVRLNDSPQWVLCRGREDRPLLLVLHGGPGSSFIPWCHHFDRMLLDDFLVVHWDQRHAGKSFDAGATVSGLTVKQYLDDATVLIELLKRRFNKDDVVLLGHSWGSLLGLRLARALPHRISRYVSVGQLVNMRRSQERGLDFLRAKIAQEDERPLSELASPPFRLAEIRAYGRLVLKYGGVFRGVSHDTLTEIARESPFTTMEELERSELGSTMAFELLQEEINSFDAFTETGPFSIPMHFFHGRHDLITHRDLAFEFYEKIETPEKSFTDFQDSAHFPMWEEPGKFQEELVRVLKRG